MYLQTVGFQHIEKVFLTDTFTFSKERMMRERPPKISHDCLFMRAGLFEKMGILLLQFCIF
jgi:hypothetical protein